MPVHPIVGQVFADLGLMPKGAKPAKLKPTPGPWRKGSYSSVVGLPIVAQPDPTQNQINVCVVRGERAQAEADAALIAVAPELLDALEWAAKQIGILSEYIETPAALAKFDECKAILAKARGEGP